MVYQTRPTQLSCLDQEPKYSDHLCGVNDEHFHIHHADYKPDKPKKKGKGQKEEPKRSRKQSPPHMFGGMSPMAHDTFME